MSADRRQYLRFDHRPGERTSLYLTSPSLAEGPIEPVDFSSGGFGVEVPRRPQLGEEVACTLHVSGLAMSGIRARVAWTRPAGEGGHGWAAGLAVLMDDDERDQFASALTALLAEIYAGS
ncbi:MAG: PilZ domain-containing protein [Nitrospinota bacterium]